jgi:hypothetical protein
MVNVLHIHTTAKHTRYVYCQQQGRNYGFFLSTKADAGEKQI